jgi:hypothetical protein
MCQDSYRLLAQQASIPQGLAAFLANLDALPVPALLFAAVVMQATTRAGVVALAVQLLVPPVL